MSRVKSRKYSIEEIAASSWRAVLETKKAETTIEKGFETCLQIAKKTGASPVGVRRKIAEALAAGKIEQKFFPVKDSVGRMLPTPFYRIKG